MIIWDEETMGTGVAELDAQHKKLFEKFNEFSEAIASKKSMEAAGEILDFLQFYAKWHFGQEEDCMNKYKCPIADQNKKAHAEFIKKFDRFYTEWQIGNMTSKLAEKTYNELEQWLLHHVARTDTQLRPCVKK
ncbi:Bacteriohemerythrin [Anaerolineales bacterium]|nr:Bacteriohemerythrin [Anaerolineales bacterium]